LLLDKEFESSLRSFPEGEDDLEEDTECTEYEFGGTKILFRELEI
jgi:hypothetical protein